MSDVEIKYAGRMIGQLNATGGVILEAKKEKLKSDIEIRYVRPGGGPTPTNMITNGDFSAPGATTAGWSSLTTQASIAVSGGKLVLTHNTTSNRNYGVYVDVNTQAGHTYLIEYKITKSMVDTDADARGIIIGFGTTSDQEITRITGVTQGTTLQGVTAAIAAANQTRLRITFLGSIATAAASDSMLEIEYLKMYDITDIISGW